jgi:hypothetical protein
MNERILELAEQAKFMAEEDINRQISYNTELKAFAEKFAELIVRECAQACMNEGASYEEKAAGAYQSNLYVTAIKKHFGVEE